VKLTHDIKVEARILKPRAEYVQADRLREGDTYFTVEYADPDLLLPVLKPVVFVGKDVEHSSSGCLYFQDIDSHRDGVRLEDADSEDRAGELRGFLHKFPSDSPAVMDFENAVDELLRCYVRRQRT
jgi:hypothetical protein